MTPMWLTSIGELNPAALCFMDYYYIIPVLQLAHFLPSFYVLSFKNFAQIMDLYTGWTALALSLWVEKN